MSEVATPAEVLPGAEWATGWSDSSGLAVLILTHPNGQVFRFAFPPETARGMAKALTDIAERRAGPGLILPN